MKKHMIMSLLGTLLVTAGCNDEWNDELYSKMVSIKAPINTDVTNLYLEYQTDGEVVYNLPVLVSGSTTNSRNITVKIDVDNDTLPKLNNYIYSVRQDLYYRQLPSQHYEFLSNECTIPAGSNQALFPIKFKFSELDLVEKYVLPVTIVDDPSYTMNTYKGRNKALLWIRPFNSYSGSYSSSSLSVYYGNSASGSAMYAATRTAQIVDENTIFWYAGLTEEQGETRGNYKIYAEFSEPTKVTELVDEDTGLPTGLVETEGTVRLYSDNPEMNFMVESNNSYPEPTYRIFESWDTGRSYVKRRYVTMSMAYRYSDYTSSSSAQFNYYCQGTMVMQRNINTLVPDDMQANYW
jgi:hypothetical protein